MNKKNILSILILITLGVLSRTVLHINNNLEFVTAFTLAAAYFIKDKKYALFTTLGILIISDLIIGNTNIVLFTWSGFLFAALVGFALRNSNIKNRAVVGLVGGITATIIFYLWTNFGVVVMTTMYAKNILGLMQSYQNGLPFLFNQLIGNIIIVPLVFIIFNYLYNSATLPKILIE
jgi:hypothetical protein